MQYFLATRYISCFIDAANSCACQYSCGLEIFALPALVVAKTSESVLIGFSNLYCVQQKAV